MGRRGGNGEMWLQKVERQRLSPRAWGQGCADTLISEFWTLALRELTFCCFKPPSFWYFVTAAPEDHAPPSALPYSLQTGQVVGRSYPMLWGLWMKGWVTGRPHPCWSVGCEREHMDTPPMMMFLCWAVWQGRAEQAGVGGSVSSLGLVYDARRAECLLHRIQRSEWAWTRCNDPTLQQAQAASEAAASGISFWVKLTGEGGTKKASPAIASAPSVTLPCGSNVLHA